MKRIILMAICVIVGLAVFSVCAAMTSSAAGEPVDDSVIVSEVNAIIMKDPDAQYLKIDISSTDGNVVLAGFIKDQDKRYFISRADSKVVPATVSLDRLVEQRIVAKIRQIKGVKSVKSLLNVVEDN